MSEENIIIPDQIQISEGKIESITDRFVDVYTCMECGNKYDYEMICVSPIGDGPCVCVECLGFDPFKQKARLTKSV